MRRAASGLPIAWQGWAVLIGYLVLLTGAAVFVLPRWSLPAFLVCVAVLSGLLVGICWLKESLGAWALRGVILRR